MMGVLVPGDVAFALLGILFEALPFVLLGALVSGAIDVFLPAEVLERHLPRRRVPAVLLCGLLGFVLPVCECAVVPVLRRLVRKGLPPACAVTYMLSAPIFSPVVAVSTFLAFRGQEAEAMTLARLGLGLTLAWLVGLVLLRLPVGSYLKGELLPGKPAAHTHEHRHLEGPAMVRLIRSAAHDFLDVMTYLMIGALITSVLNTSALQTLWTDLSPVVEIPALMGLAFILSLCSTSDAFVAASLVGVSLNARLAFLVFGPMMDLKLWFLYGMCFRRRAIVMVALGLFGAVWMATAFWRFGT